MRRPWLLLLCAATGAACDEPRARVPAPASRAADAADDAAVTPSADAASGEDAEIASDARAEPDAGSAAPDAAPSPDGGVLAPRLSRAATLDAVALFQAVKVPLVVAGREVRPRNAPVVAERDAVVRLYVRPTGGPATITAVVTVDGERFSRLLTVRRPSDDADPASVPTLTLPARVVREGARWSAALEGEPGAVVAGGAPDDARWPRDGATAELRAQADGGGLRLMLVPMRYDTDGSGRLPDTSPAQLDRVRALLGALYPLARVELTVHAPVPWSRALYPTGNVNFDRLNDLLTDLRVTESTPDDVYLYALIAPADTFSAYCGGSCVTGQSYVPQDPTDASIRVGSGVGFGGEDSAWTLAHEVGHLHGRSHAPCAVNAWDPGYPYANGDVGVWGYDARSARFIAPEAGVTDLMGYCDDQWISDYNYAAIFERVIVQRGGTVRTRARPWWGATLTRGPDGWTRGELRGWRARPTGARTRVEFLDAVGRVLGAGEATRLVRSHEDELGSAQWAVPSPPRGTARVRVVGAGIATWSAP